MFRVPGMTPEKGASQRYVSLQDIYPTLAELCGLKPPAYLDGRSLVPLLKDPNSEWESTALTGLTSKNLPEQGYITIRNEVGRYIRYGGGMEEFYEASEDPHEWTNQIDNPRHAHVIDKLRAAVPTLSEMATPMPPVKRKRKAKR